MASEAEVAEVRINTGVEDNDATFTADYIGGLVDAGSVASASLAVWRALAARYSKLTDVSEAGASHKFSDLFKHANAMVSHWQEVVATESGVVGGVRISSIVRKT